MKIKLHKNINSRDKKRGCGTWHLLLGEEQRLRLFENNQLRTIFGLNKKKETRRRMQVRNNEYHDLYPHSSPYIIRMIRSKEWDWWDVWHA
jgi:hypothetical protein